MCEPKFSLSISLLKKFHEEAILPESVVLVYTVWAGSSRSHMCEKTENLAYFKINFGSF